MGRRDRAELPFEQAAERLQRLAGIELGIETVRTHTEQVGTALAERQRAAAATVAQTQEAAEPLDTAPEPLVAEVDGVHVRFQDGWHEAKVGEIASCQVGNGLPSTNPMARPPVLVAPSNVACRAPVGEFGPVFLAEAARRGALEVVDWTQPADTDPRLRLVGPAEAHLRPVVVIGDGAHWIWELAEHFGAQRTEIVDYWHATEHVWTVARALLGEDSDTAEIWAEAWCIDLLEHGPEPWLAALRSTNAARMDYPTFRASGLPIGSGAVESAAKHVVQIRMKRSGMRWSDAGGQSSGTESSTNTPTMATLARDSTGPLWRPFETRRRPVCGSRFVPAPDPAGSQLCLPDLHHGRPGQALSRGSLPGCSSA